MEFLVPILILLYVIASVVTAVMKAAGGGAANQKGRTPMQTQTPNETKDDRTQEGQPTPQGRRVVVETTSPAGGPTMIWDEQTEQGSSEEVEMASENQWTSPDAAQPEGSAWVFGADGDGFDTEELEEEYEDDWTAAYPVEQPRAALDVKGHPVFGRISRQRLMEGVIWGEVLKTPRSQRAWPKR